MRTFRFLYSTVLAILLTCPFEIFSQEIGLNQLPDVIEEVNTKLPIQINELMFWMECYQEEPDSRVEIVIQVNPYAPDVSSTVFIEGLDFIKALIDKSAYEQLIYDILGDQIMTFINKCPVPVRVNLAFTDFNDYWILFK